VQEKEKGCNMEFNTIKISTTGYNNNILSGQSLY
jgi:hypothetical protein